MAVASEIVWRDPDILLSSLRRGESRNPAAIQALKESMRAVGFSSAYPIPIWRDGENLRKAGGHTRATVAQELGLQVATILVSAEEARRIEIEGDNYLYGTYAGKAIEWITHDMPILRAAHLDWAQSEVEAEIGREYGLRPETVKWLYRAAQSVDVVTPYLVHVKIPDDAAIFYERLLKLNADLVSHGHSPVSIEQQTDWLKTSINSRGPRHAFQAKMNEYKTRALANALAPVALVSRARSQTFNDQGIKLQNSLQKMVTALKAQADAPLDAALVKALISLSAQMQLLLSDKGLEDSEVSEQAPEQLLDVPVFEETADGKHN